MKTGVPTDWPAYIAGRAQKTLHPLLAGFHRAAWPDADTPLNELQLVALDIETTGLDARRHAIVSIGLVPFTLERIYTDRAWYQLVRPHGDLLPESVTFHHITHSDIRQAPRFAEIIGPLLERLAGKIAVVHYRRIDRPFIDEAVRHAPGESLLFPLIDTMQIEANLHPQRDPGWFARMLGRQPPLVGIPALHAQRGIGKCFEHRHAAILVAIALAIS